MKYRSHLFFLVVCLMVGLVINSCKKENQNNIGTLLTTGQWQLASLQVFHYVGALQGLTDTLGANCGLTQIFKFSSDKTCTYTNFDCIAQPNINGHWSLSGNQLIFYSDIVCQESIATRDSTLSLNVTTGTPTDSTVSVKPFQTCRIVNLGQYSLVLQTGDLENFYSPTQVRTVVQYGFIRQKSQ